MTKISSKGIGIGAFSFFLTNGEMMILPTSKNDIEIAVIAIVYGFDRVK